MLSCSGELLTCFQNPEHSRSICRMCISRTRKGERWLRSSRVTVTGFMCITPEQQMKIDDLERTDFSHIHEVENITLDGADVGVAAMSSVISLLREPKPDVIQHALLIRLNLVSAARAYFSVLNHLKDIQPDRFILFNGRFAQLSPALRAAQQLGIETFVHDRAGVIDRYSLTANTFPLDIGAIKGEMQRIVSSMEPSGAQRQKLANDWYDERRNNQPQGWESFTAKQSWGHIPELTEDKINLVMFNSSEDELEAFNEWQNPYYYDQNEGIERIVSDLDPDRFRVFLREHPNLSGVNNSQTVRLREMAALHPQLTVIPADSPVSTYSLIDSCDIVLTFGSTVGIEAVYRGKPSFLMGRAFYEDLGCCVRPCSHEELVALLADFAAGKREMLPSAAACGRAVEQYGLFNKLWGRTFRYVKIHDLRTASMVRGGKERFLRPSVVSWLMFKASCLQSALKGTLRGK
jgi:hypothetical protein